MIKISTSLVIVWISLDSAPISISNFWAADLSLELAILILYPAFTNFLAIFPPIVPVL